MTPSSQAIATPATNHMPFAANGFSRIEVRDVRAHLDDLTHEFVTYDERNRDRLLCPAVPFVDVKVRAADACAVHFDEHVVDAYLRRLNLFQPQSPFLFAFDERLHGASILLARKRDGLNAFLRRFTDGPLPAGRNPPSGPIGSPIMPHFPGTAASFTPSTRSLTPAKLRARLLT